MQALDWTPHGAMPTPATLPFCETQVSPRIWTVPGALLLFLARGGVLVRQVVFHHPMGSHPVSNSLPVVTL